MGSITRAFCDCGYENTLYLGGGFSSVREGMVYHTFQDEHLIQYRQAKENGQLQSFLLEYEPGYCAKCNTIIALPVLHVTLKDGDCFTLKAPCKECGAEVQLYSKERMPCPVCNRLLHLEEKGLWD